MNALAPAPIERLRRRLVASVRREARLRSWLSKLEARAVEVRETRAPGLSDALALKMPFVREQLRLAARKTAWLREQIGKAERP